MDSTISLIMQMAQSNLMAGKYQGQILNGG